VLLIVPLLVIIQITKAACYIKIKNIKIVEIRKISSKQKLIPNIYSSVTF